jgi:general secretion pathway protein M
MTIAPLSPPFRRALALAILVALVAGGYYAIAQPLIDSYADNRATIAQLQDTLARYRRAARALAPRQAELASLKKSQATADGFLQGSSDTLIAAQIQNRVKQTADAAKAELKSSQVLPAEAEGKLKRIAVRDQMSATTAGLLAMFHDLEAQSPLLFLDNVTLQVRPTALRDRSDPGSGDVIDVQFDVYGYSYGNG